MNKSAIAGLWILGIGAILSIIYFGVFPKKDGTPNKLLLPNVAVIPSPEIHDICKDPNPPKDCLKG